MMVLIGRNTLTKQMQSIASIVSLDGKFEYSVNISQWVNKLWVMSQWAMSQVMSHVNDFQNSKWPMSQNSE